MASKFEGNHENHRLVASGKKTYSRAHMQAFSHEKYLEVRNLYVKCLNWIGLIQINPRTKKTEIMFKCLGWCPGADS